MASENTSVGTTGGPAYDRAYRAGQKVAEFERNKVEPLRQSMNARTERDFAAEKRIAESPRGVLKTGFGRTGAGRNRTRIYGDKTTGEETPQKYIPRGGYILFFLVLGLAIGKDIIDIASALLDLVGIGLTATVLGAPVGVALTAFSEIVDKLTGIFIDFTMLGYFAFIGGKWGLRFVIMSIGAIIDAVPILNILPMTTVMFVAAFIMGRIGEKVVSKIAQSTPIGKVYSLGKKAFS